MDKHPPVVGPDKQLLPSKESRVMSTVIRKLRVLGGDIPSYSEEQKELQRKVK